MSEIKIKTLDEILDALKGKALKEIKDEFMALLKLGKSDSVDFIKESAQNAARWLTMLGNGQLTSDEVNYLLKKQKKHAQIYANTESIVVRARIQKLAYRLLDIAIDVLAGAIVLV